MTERPRVLIARPADQAVELAERLRALGIDPVVVPAVAVAPPASWTPVDQALGALTRYDWVLFTSANGVHMVFQRRVSTGTAGPAPPGLRWAAIGPGTAAALAGYGITGAWLPSRYLGKAAGGELPARVGQHVLRVRAEAASPAATEALRARGILVDEVIAYRTVEAPPESDPLLRRAWADGVDGIVFTSASTVRGFAALAARVGIDDDMGSVLTIAIGPVTAQAMEAAGWEVGAVASQHSIDGIVRVIEERRTALAAGRTAR